MSNDHLKTDFPSKDMPNGHDSLDELLVMRWQDGDVEAMDQLVERWQSRLWRHARRLTDSNEEAWDAMQDAWLAMLRAIRRLDDPGRFIALAV